MRDAGNTVRQYHPVEFGWQPPSKTKKVKGRKLLVPVRAHGTTLVRDDFWAIPPTEPVWWFLEGENWKQDGFHVLDRCLERLFCFGRAETLTQVERWTSKLPHGCAPNCDLQSEPTSAFHVPVLSPAREATRQDLERVSDHPEARCATVPPGARWMFANLPERPLLRERPRASG